LADPERFFRMLEAVGVHILRCPLPDHASFHPLPWPAHAQQLLVTEKDAVKLRPDMVGAAQVWVVALDFQLPTEFTTALAKGLRGVTRTSS
jgi:tetraacyldisaccharide 4'-kinase